MCLENNKRIALIKHILLFMKKWRRFCIFSKRISKEIVNELKIEENNNIKYLY